MANVLMKKLDTYPNFKHTLKMVNQETSVEEAVNLTTALKVRLIIKPAAGGAATEILCTGPNGGAFDATGLVEGYFLQTTFNPAKTPETYFFEYEIEWAAGKYQSVPPKGVYSVEIGGPEGGTVVGEPLYVKKDDNEPRLKGKLTLNGVPIDFEKGGPTGEGVNSVKVYVWTANGKTELVKGGTCTGWKGATIKNKEGKVEYPWTEVLAAAEAGLVVEFVIEWKTTVAWEERGHAGTKVKPLQTCPSSGHFSITTEADLGGAV